MKTYAIIVAGGSGSRMNAATPKQFLLLKDKPLLVYSMESFFKQNQATTINLVLPDAYLSEGQQIIQQFFPEKNIIITGGGETRFHSVQNGLKLVTEESIVHVHDAVRCLVTPDLIQRCYEAALTFGTAVPVIECKDSMRMITENGNVTTDRSKLKIVQTPQTFKSTILLEAFNTTYEPSFTDEANVVEKAGHSIKLIEGEEQNIKITRPVDLLIAEQIISSAI